MDGLLAQSLSNRMKPLRAALKILKAKAALAEIPFPACPYPAEFPGALARAGYLAVWAECPVPVSWVRLPSLTLFTGKIWTNVVVPKTRSTASWRPRLPRPIRINPPVLISSEAAHFLQHHRKPGIFGNNGRSGAAPLTSSTCRRPFRGARERHTVTAQNILRAASVHETRSQALRLSTKLCCPFSQSQNGNSHRR
jgi:hypothetical protein